MVRCRCEILQRHFDGRIEVLPVARYDSLCSRTTVDMNHS